MAEPVITFLTATVESIDYSTCRIVVQKLNSSSAGHITRKARVAQIVDSAKYEARNGSIPRKFHSAPIKNTAIN
jgi:hypothetical protein